MQRKILLFLAMLFLLLNGTSCQKKEEPVLQLEETELEEDKKVQKESSEDFKEKAEKEAEREKIVVYVCGAVCKEGVYEFDVGSRVYEAVQKAGGFAEGAAASQINQAALLEDEERLYIPRVEELQNEQISVDTAAGTEEKQGKINLNTAGKEELMTLAGIGESKAESILRYREEKGRFQSVEDIKQISGIKDGVFEKIKEYITI